MRATLLLSVSIVAAATLSVADPAFAQVASSHSTVTSSQTSAPIAIGEAQTVTNRVVEPVTPSFDNLISAPIEYTDSGVAKAQYFKASDLTPEQNKAFQDEVRRVRTYQSQNGGSTYTPDYIYNDSTGAAAASYGSTASPFETATYGANSPSAISDTYEIELYDTAAPSNVTVVTEPLATQSFASATHTVSKGDTLYNLSKRYDVTVAQIQTENGLSGTALSLGQTLRIPSTGLSALNTGISQPIFVSAPVRKGAVTRRVVQPVSTSNRAPAQTYAVLKKDTLYSIAKRTCVSVNDLALQNGITDPSTIQLGQKLDLPLGHCQAN